MPPSLRASLLYNRWRMLEEVFRAGQKNPGAETPQFGVRWTQIKVRLHPVHRQNIPEPPDVTEKKDPAVKAPGAWR